MAEQSESPKQPAMESLKTTDLDSSDSDDHFSDARSGAETPIPITRVEKVDDEPSHGEVPGTEAYELRKGDAVPDEVEVIDDDTEIAIKPDTIAPAAEGEEAIRPRAGGTPGDLPIPITRVEKVNDEPSHGDVPGTEAYKLRGADAKPDEVKEVGDAPGMDVPSSSTSEPLTGSPTGVRSSTISHTRRVLSGVHKYSMSGDYNEEENGDFGDDFDDFEEGEEDDEFGDFDDGFQVAEPAPVAQALPAVLSFPVLNFSDLDLGMGIYTATEPYINALFPPDSIDASILPPISVENSVFLTQRSASLWAQLVAPPPLQPPNWIRSRIRRLFLVSLGVPVDLDEILPASKQNKLILPSVHLTTSGSPRNSTDSRSISRLKLEGTNGSTTSVDSEGKQRSESKRRRGPDSPLQFDLVSARQLCVTTNEALDGLSIEELKEHVTKLEAMEVTAKELLEYWTWRTDEKLGDREAFEGVIENLVKHARKVRK
ncbi:hypothetical protein BJ878DRAFT_557470 [Calycina marina]|uniref:Uncharacterized protein n=1 Tax=Calycina marina TaxID=1763456 RepID=A0A9P8CCI8_9HELO|nr:hypothetical protein BJ878DRAFT_557470 [Calycina marina]